MLVYEVLKIRDFWNYWGCCSRPHKNSSATHFGVATHRLGTTDLEWTGLFREEISFLNETTIRKVFRIQKHSNQIWHAIKRLLDNSGRQEVCRTISKVAVAGHGQSGQKITLWDNVWCSLQANCKMFVTGHRMCIMHKDLHLFSY